MGVHLGKDHYGKGGDRQRPKHLSYRPCKHVTDFLVARHYLELPAGLATWHPDPRLRRTTRFRATRGLIDLCHEYAVNRYMIRALPESRGHHPEEEEKHGQSHGELLEYVDTPFTRTARRNLERINDFIAGHMINLDLTDDREEALMLRLRRTG